MIFRNRALLLILCMWTMYGMELPPMPQATNNSLFPERFLSLPADLQREILYMNAPFYTGIHIHELAREFLALAGTNKIVRSAMNKPEYILAILKRIPYTAGALYFAEKIQCLPAMEHDLITTWLATRMRTNGPELCESVRSTDLDTVHACLLEKNIDLNRISDVGLTPLMIACRNQNIGIAAALLIAGANPNIRDNGTALIHAACHVHCALIDILLQAGANPDIKNDSGKTALDTVKEADILGLPKVGAHVLLIQASENKKRRCEWFGTTQK